MKHFSAKQAAKLIREVADEIEKHGQETVVRLEVEYPNCDKYCEMRLADKFRRYQ